MSDQSSTIVALASGGLPSGIAVVRLSGPAVRAVLGHLVGAVPEARRASLRTIRDGSGRIIDTGLVLFFPGPESSTGEDCGELHLHGGRAVVAGAISAILAVPACRVAEPGEFARRAFVNGRSDLLATEALADLIDADTEAERRFAIENGRERHRELYAQWRSQILHARAMVEAELDFADEEDVPGSVSDRVWDDVGRTRDAISGHLAGYAKAKIVKDGFDVVIAGPPNAGKSSLLNRLVEEDVAIVTEEAGTTRDLISATISVGGIKVRLTDTAGLRDGESKAEQLGIHRSRQRLREADLILSVFSPSDLQEPLLLPDKEVSPVVLVATKSDMGGADGHPVASHSVSAATGSGLARLLQDIGDRARAAHPVQDELVPWRQRHVDLLGGCRDSLGRAMVARQLELRSEELRLASLALGKLAGDIGVEDMLDEIFSSFCIGK